MPEEFRPGPFSPSGLSSRSNDASPSAHPAPTLSDLKDRVSGDLTQAADAVEASAATVMTKVQDKAAEQKNFAARQVGGVATALEKVGSELEAGDQRDVGRLARRIGHDIQAIAKDMEGRDLGEIAGMAEAFGRRQPVAFLGAAALAGLVASRFLTASAKRPASRPSQGSPDGTSHAQDSSDRTGGTNNG
ncbi:nutrient deprivation-induced protein [Rhizobium sp. 1399]|uniref:nutrient deprivation-induced protein n=1 Tax=Rhizobium sp. 1399 TaxID=2817758 RepID=UPI000DE06040|nr:nutrient deprivation-induced protein [Rhizobium sp. 1399]MDR6668023.1 hypothetical protein [Rhizobium sp. 1399]